MVSVQNNIFKLSAGAARGGLELQTAVLNVTLELFPWTRNFAPIIHQQGYLAPSFWAS